MNAPPTCHQQVCVCVSLHVYEVYMIYVYDDEYEENNPLLICEL